MSHLARLRMAMPFQLLRLHIIVIKYKYPLGHFGSLKFPPISLRNNKKMSTPAPL